MCSFRDRIVRKDRHVIEVDEENNSLKISRVEPCIEFQVSTLTESLKQNFSELHRTINLVFF